MYIFLAIIIWLLVNYFTGGLSFYTLLCVLAWVFLIMPSLLKFKLWDFKLLKDNKKIVFLNIFLNFLVIPSLFFSIWYAFFGDSKIIYALLFLWLIPWWWMLFNWINKSSGNIKLWFSIFFLNMIIFTILFFPLNNFLENKAISLNQNNSVEQNKELDFLKKLNNENKKPCPLHNLMWWWNDDKINSLNKPCPLWTVSSWIVDCNTTWWHINPIAIIVVLIILPFLISRIILLSDKISNFIIPKISNISQIATFFIIWYIFSLKELNIIFSVSILKILTILWVLALIYFIFYSITFLISKKINVSADLKPTLFWWVATRFLTMWLIFSFAYSSMFWVDFILVIALAYFIQISFSYLFYFLIKKYVR